MDGLKDGGGPEGDSEAGVDEIRSVRERLLAEIRAEEEALRREDERLERRLAEFPASVRKRERLVARRREREKYNDAVQKTYSALVNSTVQGGKNGWTGGPPGGGGGGGGAEDEERLVADAARMAAEMVKQRSPPSPEAFSRMLQAEAAAARAEAAPSRRGTPRSATKPHDRAQGGRGLWARARGRLEELVSPRGGVSGGRASLGQRTMASQVLLDPHSLQAAHPLARRARRQEQQQQLIGRRESVALRAGALHGDLRRRQLGALDTRARAATRARWQHEMRDELLGAMDEERRLEEAKARVLARYRAARVGGAQPRVASLARRITRQHTEAAERTRRLLKHYHPLLDEARESTAHESRASQAAEGMSRVKGPPTRGARRPGTSPATPRSARATGELHLSPVPLGSRRCRAEPSPGVGVAGRDPAGRVRTQSRHAIRRESLSQDVEGATEALALARAREDGTRRSVSTAPRTRPEAEVSLRRLQPPLPGEVPPRHQPLSPEARRTRVSIYRESPGGASVRHSPPGRRGPQPGWEQPPAPAPAKEGRAARFSDAKEFTVPLDDLPSGPRGSTLRETVSVNVAGTGPA